MRQVGLSPKKGAEIGCGLMRGSSERGFTLLEVLVALIILGLAFAFLTNTITGSLYLAERIDSDSRAASLADEILAGVGEDIPLRLGMMRGGEGKLSWRLIVAPYKHPGDVFVLYQLNLTITDGANHVIGQWRTLRLAAQ